MSLCESVCVRALTEIDSSWHSLPCMLTAVWIWNVWRCQIPANGPEDETFELLCAAFESNEDSCLLEDYANAGNFQMPRMSFAQPPAQGPVQQHQPQAQPSQPPSYQRIPTARRRAARPRSRAASSSSSGNRLPSA